MKNLPYSEGSLFLVPLKDGGYARGVIARSAPKGKVLFGYFFGPRLKSKLNVESDELKAEEASLCIRFGDLGLIKNFWPIIGKVASWDRIKWPMVNTVRRDVLGLPKNILVQYDDNDPSKVISEKIINNDHGLPSDGLAGYRYVEELLNKIVEEEK